MGTAKTMELELEKLFGLPAHPLIVHLPVVLIPLAALGAVVIAVSPNWRQRIGWLVVIAAGISTVFVPLATGSGEALGDMVEDSGSRRLIHEHSELGEQLLPVMVIFFAILLGFMLVTRANDRKPKPKALVVGLAIASVVAAG